MAKNKNTYITVTKVKHTEVSEIDFDLHSKFKFDYENGGDFISIDGPGQSLDSEPVDISRMIKILADMKQKGANYVRIEYHVDHIGYEVEGLNIRKSNDQEISTYEEKNESLEDKKKRILALRDQIKVIENS